jgi:hypothetical protein
MYYDFKSPTDSFYKSILHNYLCKYNVASFLGGIWREKVCIIFEWIR